MTKKDVEFKVGENTLRGTIFIPDGEGTFPSIISFHGSGSKGAKFYEWGEKFAQKGMLFFAFNFTGCGRSDGDYSSQAYQDALVDAKTAFEFFLNQQEVNPQRVGLIGGSFGGFLASMALPYVQIKSLILLAPSAHVGDLSSKIDRGDLGEEVKYFLDKNNWFTSSSYKNIADFKKPLLVIKSENDENVPADVVDKYFQVSNSQKKELKNIAGADHRLSTREMRNEAFEIMINWFSETL